MNYEETLKYMFSQLPMFQRIGRPAFKPDLGNSWKLMDLLDKPQNRFKTIHIAGTNGKGSTAHFITSVLQEHGYKVGLYTSPHLKDFRERIRINGEMVSKEYVIRFMENYKQRFSDIGLSFFEMTVGMAFKYFADEKVDIAVIETGMGGRLDSTNVITPLLSVITNISFDHTQFLGETLSKIAFEKAGIIKTDIPVIVGEKHPDTNSVFEKQCAKENSKLIYATDSISYSKSSKDKHFLCIEDISINNKKSFDKISSPLTGNYQKKNIVTALASLEELKEILSLKKEKIESGFKNIIKNTQITGRWQVLNEIPLTICDTGHNLDGIQYIINQIDEIEYKTLHFVLGMVNDKNIDTILNLLPKDATYYFCKADIPRGLEVKKLIEQAQQFGLKGSAYPSIKEAFETAKQNADNKDLVFVGGSTFTVAEVL
ncbi:MAG: folylpolyglutamate synthase/dihydrofolate synthase family protein [Bacteroidota bacterium]|nr:folylpolyglutamate synthase/dihydrofolate synthase family protein [Bacteroidota bacterium]